MKSKREYIILIAIIIVLAVVYGLQRNAAQKSEFSLPTTPAFTATDLTRIDIVSAADTIQLGKQDGKWVMLPQGYPVEERLISVMVEGLANFKLTNIISESDADYARYQLDDANKVHVEAFTGDTKVLDMDLGAVVANNFRHSYVKIAGDPNVYHGRGNLRTYFDTNEFELREKQILTFAKEDIAGIVLNQNGNERIVKSQVVNDEDGNAIKIWLGPENVYVDSGDVDGFLGFVGSTNVFEFLPQDEPMPAGTQYILTLLSIDEQQIHMLRVYDYEPNGDDAEEEYGIIHTAVSSDVLSPFQLTKAQQEDIVKRFNDMLKPKATDDAEGSGQLHVENLPE